MKRSVTILLLLIGSLWCVGLNANPRPEKLESIDISDYRRVTGGPGTAFYFLKKRGGFEVRNFAANTSFARTLARSRKLQTSPNGNYYAVISYNNFRPTELRVTAIELFDIKGDRVWSRKNPDCSAFTLTDAGPILVGISRAEGLPESGLRFFDAAGEVVNSVRVDQVANITFSGDGRYLFALSGEQALLKFTAAGQLIEEYPACSQYRVSNNGSLVAMLRNETVRLYQRDSLLLEREIGTESFRDLQFSADSKRVALLTDSRLELIDLRRSLTNWRWQVADAGYRLVDLAVDSEFTRFLCSGNNSEDQPEIRNSRGKVYLLNDSGQLVWNYDLSYTERPVGHPILKFDSRTALLSIISGERLELFAL